MFIGIYSRAQKFFMFHFLTRFSVCLQLCVRPFPIGEVNDSRYYSQSSSYFESCISSIKPLILFQGFSIELLYVLLGYFLISMILTPHCIVCLGRAAQQKIICTILKDVVYTPGSYMVKF